jgi:hypothetical protein
MREICSAERAGASRRSRARHLGDQLQEESQLADLSRFFHEVDAEKVVDNDLVDSKGLD